MKKTLRTTEYACQKCAFKTWSKYCRSE